MATQWAVLPLCWYNGATGERTFMYIFAIYLLLDFVLVHLDPLLILHHVFCLVGHLIVCVWLPEGLRIYLSGVVALEIGSGSMNQFALYPDKGPHAAVYAVGMTLSNSAALWLTYEWVRLPIPIFPKVLNMVITAIMIYLRQKSCHKYITKGPMAGH